MGLRDWFSTFCGNIQVQDAGTISHRYKLITGRLNTDFRNTTSSTANSLYVGSYGRNTAIAGFSDLDMVYELPASYYHTYHAYQGNGQSALLQLVRSSLQKTYSTSSLGADGQVVVIGFKDGITFEVMPAFVNNEGSYTFPDSNNGGSWRTTNPRPEIQAIRTGNDWCNGNLIRLCRMMRCWKRQWSVPIGGLLVDTLAHRFLLDWEHRDKSYLYYDFMCRDFFDFMANQDTTQTMWKAVGSGQWLYSSGAFQYKARRCCNIAKEAIEYETSTPKREYSAKLKWREIFGNPYPA